MKFKSLLPLAVILVLLLGLVVLRRTGQEELTLTEEVDLRQLVPADMEAADIAKLELYAGGAPDEKVVLARSEAEDRWRVPTHYDAPVKPDKIEKFLDSLKTLEGEFRASAEDDAALDSYNLSDKSGFHITGYRTGSETPDFHVLVGKTPGYGTVFIRQSGSNDVLVGDVNFRQDAGLYTPDTATPPKADIWLDKQIVALERDKIQKVALTMPDKSMVFEKREKPRDDAEEGETPPPVEYEWVAASGGIGTLNMAGMTGLLNKLAGTNATTIVDPAEKEKWNLTDPAYVCEVTLEGQDETFRIEAGRAKPGGQGYLRVVDSEPEMIFNVNRYDFGQLFPNGDDVFNLPGAGLDGDTLTQIELVSLEERTLFEKDGEEWSVTEPAVDLDAETSAIESIAAAIADWTPVDYADSPAGANLDAPERTVRVQTASGESYRIDLGRMSRHAEGAYARVEGDDRTLVMGKTDLDRIFVGPKDFFARDIFDINEDDIIHVEITKEETTYSLDKTETGWKVTQGDAMFDGNPDRIEDYTFALAIFEAEDFVFGDVRVQGGILGSVSFTMSDDTKHSFNVEVEQDGTYAVTVAGKSGVAFLANKAEIERVLAPIDRLKIEEPAPEADAEAVVEDPTQ